MENPGERLVGDYLRYIKGCDFIDFNVPTKKVQGELTLSALTPKGKQRTSVRLRPISRQEFSTSGSATLTRQIDS